METLPSDLLFHEVVSRLSFLTIGSLRLVDRETSLRFSHCENWESLLEKIPYQQLQKEFVSMVETGQSWFLYEPSIVRRIDKRVLCRIGYHLMERGEKQHANHVRKQLQALYHDPCGLNRYEPIVALIKRIVEMFNGAPKDVDQRSNWEDTTFSRYWKDRVNYLPSKLWEEAKMIGMPVYYGGEYIARQVNMEKFCMNANRAVYVDISTWERTWHPISRYEMDRAISKFYCVDLGNNGEMARFYQNRGGIQPYLHQGHITWFAYTIHDRSAWVYNFHMLKYRKVIVTACTVLEPDEWYDEIMSSAGSQFSDRDRHLFITESLHYARKNGYTEWKRRAERLIK